MTNIPYSELSYDENYIDILTHDSVLIEPARLKTSDKAIALITAPILLFILYKILQTEPPQNIADYLFISLFTLMFSVVYILIIRAIIAPAPDCRVDESGLNWSDKTRTAWGELKSLHSNFSGLTFTQKNGQKRKINLQDTHYRFDLFMQNLIWLHKKYNFTKGKLLTQTLNQIDRQGIFFGHEESHNQRQQKIRFFLSAIAVTLFFAAIAAAIVFLSQNTTHAAAPTMNSLIKLAGMFLLVISLEVVLLGAVLLNRNHKFGQDIIANAQGLDITYADGRKQSVSWTEIEQAWQDPNYGANGQFLFEIHHATDGAVFLIDLLPYLVEEYSTLHHDQQAKHH